MADLSPGDIKDPEEAPPAGVPPPTSPAPAPAEEEKPEEEEKSKPSGLVAAFEHLLDAVTELTRTSGSPPAVTGALERVRAVLEKL